jgi:hypothetical protein
VIEVPAGSTSHRLAPNPSPSCPLTRPGPERAEESLPSFAHGHPDPSVRNAPAAPDFAVITRPEPTAAAARLAVHPADEAAADELPLPELPLPELPLPELPLPELPQAAVGRAAPGATASPAPSRTAPGVRIPTAAIMVTMSRLLACAPICRHSHYGRSGAAA